jgi:hypothetical protein
MAKKRTRISDGQLRTLAPPAHVLVTLDQIEADVTQRRAKAALV